MKSASTPLTSCSEILPCKRRDCRGCNNSYMRTYLRQRRRARPVAALLERAKARARVKGLPYDLRHCDLALPTKCPVLGTALSFDGRRSHTSPSLDRVVPDKGYVVGNVRIISDRANRLKGDRRYQEIVELSRRGRPDLRADYHKIAVYLSLEALLLRVRDKAASPCGRTSDWSKIALFLDAYLQRRGGDVAT